MSMPQERRHAALFFETDHALSVVLPRFLFVIVQTSLEIMLISASVSSCAKMRWDWGEGNHAQYTYKAGGRKASQQMSIGSDNPNLMHGINTQTQLENGYAN